MKESSVENAPKGWHTIWHKGGTAMKPRERIRFIATIDTLKRVAEEYPGKTIENVIVQLEARLKELN